MFVLLLFTMWLGKLVIFPEIQFFELCSGWQGWNEKMLVRCLTPCLSHCRLSVRCLKLLLWLVVSNQYGACSLYVRSTYLVDEWMLTTYSKESERLDLSFVGQGIKLGIVFYQKKEETLRKQKWNYFNCYVMSQNWSIKKWII